MRNFFYFCRKLVFMYHHQLSDKDILDGFRKGDALIIREYFYGYCRVGYQLFNELIGGFRYVVLDALKWYQKEYGSIRFEKYLRQFDLGSNFRLQFNQMVEDVCDHAPLTRTERLIIDMLMLRGFKVKEVAAQMGMTSSAISQKFQQLKMRVIIPYFRKNFDMDLDMPEMMDECVFLHREVRGAQALSLMNECMDYTTAGLSMEKKRTTPELITELQPNEIFVFGSNLKGLHGGGAAYIAYRKFGAVIGQGVGLQGHSYAIPTMQGGVETIRPYVDEFIEFAKAHPELTFLVTRIGCGIAGFTNEEISPLFERAHDVKNIVLPEGW